MLYFTQPIILLFMLLYYMAKMIEKGKHYFKEWREFRGISLRDLENRLEIRPGEKPIVSYSVLSRIESGKIAFTEETLNAIAFALDVDRVDLLSKNPYKDGEVIDLLRHLDEKDRSLAIDMLKAMINSRAG